MSQLNLEIQVPGEAMERHKEAQQRHRSYLRCLMKSEATERTNSPSGGLFQPKDELTRNAHDREQVSTQIA